MLSVCYLRRRDELLTLNRRDQREKANTHQRNVILCSSFVTFIQNQEKEPTQKVVCCVKQALLSLADKQLVVASLHLTGYLSILEVILKSFYLLFKPSAILPQSTSVSFCTPAHPAGLSGQLLNQAEGLSGGGVSLLPAANCHCTITRHLHCFFVLFL